MPKKTPKKKSKDSAPPVLGRLGAEQWIAVRQKSGAGPMEPKPRRGTRTRRERDAIEREAGGPLEKDV
ncbi:MAG: hypothetical protein M3169_09840 [Candidatus Eremiobacteraeota bacterium]|nr:hypothetical protein [Candidatus Eremiobacteraeota bacterium]